MRRLLPVLLALVVLFAFAAFGFAALSGYFTGGLLARSVAFVLKGLAPLGCWPYPVLFVAAIAGWVRWGMRYRREWTRLRDGQCLGCGYDVRASQDRCPECGQTIARLATRGRLNP
jgi:hypothetical protein